MVKLSRSLLMKVKNRLLDFEGYYIYQDSESFKMSLDSLLLSNFVTIRFSDKRILDIGTGNAPIPLLLSFRTKAKIYGIELQEGSSKLARESVCINGLDNQIEIINDDANNLKNYFTSDSFDVIVSNPPYFNTNNNDFMNNNDNKAIARHEGSLDLKMLISLAKVYLKTGGYFAMVHRPDRFMEIIQIMRSNNIEPKKVRFVYPKKDKYSNILLIEGVKNGKIGLKVLPPLIVYNDDNTYTDEIKLMFRK